MLDNIKEKSQAANPFVYEQKEKGGVDSVKLFINHKAWIKFSEIKLKWINTFTGTSLKPSLTPVGAAAIQIKT